MKEKASINSQAFYNMLSTFVLTGINFLTMPIFTRVLGATNYGVYTIFNSWMIIFVCIMGMQTHGSLSTAQYVFKEDIDKYRASVLFLGTLSSLLVFLLCILFLDKLSVFFGLPAPIVIILLLCAFSNYVIGYRKEIFVVEKNARQNFYISVTLSITSITLSLLLVKKLENDNLYLSRVYGDFFPFFVAAVIFWIQIIMKRPVCFNKRYWKYCLSMCVPLIFHTLANDVLKQSDKIMLQNLGFNGADVGIYGFLCTFSHIVSIILAALNNTWIPFYFDDLNENAQERLNKKVKNYLELYTVIVCGFLLLSREVCYFFAGEEYWRGIDVIPILVLGVYFMFMYQFPVNFEFFNRKTKLIAIGTIASALVNISLNWLMIPLWGMYGAALATAVSYGLLFIAHYIVASNLKSMKFHMHMYNYYPGLLAIFVSVTLFYILKDYWIIRWSLGTILGGYELASLWKRKTVF